MSQVLRCSLAGGLLLVDAERLRNWERESLLGEFDPEGDFSIALDVRGLTDQVYSWPSEDWSDVWIRETQGLVSRVNNAELSLLILHEGEIYVDLSFHKDTPGGHRYLSLASDVHISSGRLVVAELDSLVEDWGLRDAEPEDDRFVYKEVETRPGLYKSTYIINKDLHVSGTSRQMTFGTPEDPAVFLRLSPIEAASAELDELFHVDLSGLRCVGS